jgi:broad specificity phosphatase PhoE
MPNGESLLELQQRAWRVVEKIISGSENALIVSHNFTIAAILCRLRNISLSEFRSTCVDTASKTIVRFQNGEAAIDLLNDRSHLQGDVT